jgi:FSR family fosmidomycin resistance protein-like MFS transporter
MGATTFNNIKLASYTLAHFAVDFGCAFALNYWNAQTLPSAPLYYATFLTYSALAFGLQPFIGLAVDKRGPGQVGAIGCALTLLGVFTTPGCYEPFLFVPALICGNALFHVAGGKETLNLPRGRMSSIGIFVSSGATGISLGLTLGYFVGPQLWALPLALLAFCTLLLAILRIYDRKHSLVQTPLPPSSQVFSTGSYLCKPLRAIPALAIISAVLIIALSNASGRSLAMAWQAYPLYLVLSGVASSIGRALGGLAADRYGARWTCFFPLIIALVCFTCWPQNPWLGCIGFACLNASMPVTIWMIAGQLKSYPTFAYGVAHTVMMIATVLPFVLGAYLLTSPLPLAIMLVCLALLCFFCLSNNHPAHRAGAKEKRTLQ